VPSKVGIALTVWSPYILVRWERLYHLLIFFVTFTTKRGKRVIHDKERKEGAHDKKRKEVAT
jgi:hypothetical protein